MKCHNCARPAMFVMKGEEENLGLCLDCYHKLVQASATECDMLERAMNYCAAEIEMGVGLPGMLPRFPERKVIQTGGITLNNIRVDRSAIGVLNTGNIESVDSSVTVLTQAGEQDLAQAIRDLTEAVISTNELARETKEELLEILSLISTEATAPTERRRSRTVLLLLDRLAKVIGTVAALAAIWDRVDPILRSAFG